MKWLKKIAAFIWFRIIVMRAKIKQFIVSKLLLLRAKERMATMREAVVKANKLHQSTGRKVLLVKGQHDWDAIDKKTLKKIANTKKQKKVKSGFKQEKAKKPVIDHETIQYLEKRSPYVAN